MLCVHRAAHRATLKAARRSLRLRVGGLTLALEAPAPTPVLCPQTEHAPFVVTRGADVRLALSEESVPEPSRAQPLFESGSLWRVFRHGCGVLYHLRSEACDPQVYKGVAIDAALRRGVLYFPRGPRSPQHALDYPLDELIFQHRLALDGHVEVHAGGVVHEGQAAIFCGASGAGKSTLSRLITQACPDALILSDDRIILRRSPRGVSAHGTPWHGEASLSSPAWAPLGAVFFLRQASVTRAVSLAAPVASGLLYARSFPPPWDRAGVARVLEACTAVASTIPCFDLEFAPDETAAGCVIAMLSGARPGTRSA
jgi:hypothetical protein